MVRIADGSGREILALESRGLAACQALTLLSERAPIESHYTLGVGGRSWRRLQLPYLTEVLVGTSDQYKKISRKKRALQRCSALSVINHCLDNTSVAYHLF